MRKNVGVGGVKYTAGERERYLVFRGGRIITAMGLYFPKGINGVTLHKAWYRAGNLEFCLLHINKY